jgi:hypothetical protein
MKSDEPTLSAEAIDPQRVALVWLDSDRAVITTWHDQPETEHLDSGVTPHRKAVGSVRRGPARPHGGGRVAGHGTEQKHERTLMEFFGELVAKLGNLETVEISGRGSVHQQFAEQLRTWLSQHNENTAVTTRTLARRPSDRQLKARLRKLSGTELPRRRVGRYRLPATEPTTATGRPLRPAAGRRTLRPAPLPGAKHIAEEIDLMLGDPPPEAE